MSTLDRRRSPIPLFSSQTEFSVIFIDNRTMPIKLKTLVESLQQEANLGGWSRSGAKPKWNQYVVPNFDSSKTYFVDRDDSIYGDDKKAIEKVVKKDPLNILSTDLATWGQSQYAKVRMAKTGSEGWIRISSISKGDTGTPNSKEFLPTKLGLVGKEYTDEQALIADTMSGLEKNYGGPEYEEIRSYLTECMYLISGDVTPLQESIKPTQTYKLSKKYGIGERDIGVLSKNFGEVLAAIHILAQDEKTEKVYFPSKANTPLYDFVSVKTSEKNEYYSVKSHGGSSTSAENLKFLMNNFAEKDEFLEKYPSEIEVILSIVNDKTAGKTTLTNIQEFFETRLEEKTKAIIDILSGISTSPLKSLSQDDLNSWFKDVVNNSTEEKFIETMNSVYSTVLGDMESPPKTSDKVLKQMFNDKVSKGNGYLYYPMGAYIKQYLNDPNKPYLTVLNVLLNYGTYIHQFTVDLYSDSFDIKIERYDQKKFKFDYNGMANSPANRPLGFKETTKSDHTV